MKHCAVAKRMKSACTILKPRKLHSELSNLEAEMDEIAKLLVKCCNDYIVNGGNADGLKYMSEINAVRTFLPDPETYRDVIVSSCANPSINPANPEFYKFEIIRVVAETVTFKSLFSLDAAEESVEKFVVLQVGQRAALILVSLARISSMQSRFYTALACCRVGLILVRLLYHISSPVLWTPHKVLLFLLAAEAVQSCTFLAAFDHTSCCRCAEIMDKAVLAYQDFFNIFRSYGDRLINTEEDPMLSAGGSLAEIQAIVEKLAIQMIDWSAGSDLLFNFSMFYFHMARKDVAALRSAQLITVPPRDENVEHCVRGFQAHSDSYMLAAAMFCRGCFLSAACHKGISQERTQFLMAAEIEFLNVLNIAETNRIHVASIPWLRLIEKASLANLVTRCRILVRCATTFDVHHFRNSLDHLYFLVKTPFPHGLEDCISSRRKISAVASLAFIYTTDHTPGAPDVFEGSEKASVSLHRAECESLASQLLEDEETLSFCLKVFCDLTEELLGGEEVLSNGETQLRRCLYRLQLLSMPIFSAQFKRISTPPSMATSSAGSDNLETSRLFQVKADDVNPAESVRNSECKHSRSNESDEEASKGSSSDDLWLHKNPSRQPHIDDAKIAFSDCNIDNWSESPLYDLVLKNGSRLNCRIQSMNSTENNLIELQMADAPSSEPHHVSEDKDSNHSKAKQLNEPLKIDLEAITDLDKGQSSIINTPKLSVRRESSNSVPPVVSEALDDFVTALLNRGFDILNKRTVSRTEKNVVTKSSHASGVTSTADGEWVAVFPPNLAFPEGEGRTNIKSEAVTVLEVEHPFCATELSRVIKKAAAVLEKTIEARACSDLFPILKEHPASKKGIQCEPHEAASLKFKSRSCKLSDDTENWLGFLRKSSLLTTVEDNLELFFIDGTDDLLILKNTIAKDLQTLCRATIGNHGSQSQENPAYLSVFAHCAYTTALRHLKRGSGLADFHILLTTLFDALDENPFGAAALWT